jgi:hypothetical protein
MAKSALKKPELLTSPSGRSTYSGSIAATAGTLINPKRELQIVRQLKEAPIHASEIAVDDMSPYNPHHQEAIRRFIGRLHEEKYAELIRDDAKKPIGWQLTTEGKTYLEGLESE